MTRPAHEVPRKGFEVGEAVRIIGGHDEAEMVAVAIASFGESTMICIIALSVEHSARGAIAGSRGADTPNEP